MSNACLQRALYSYYDKAVLRHTSAENWIRNADKAAEVRELYRTVHLHSTVAKRALFAREDQDLVENLCSPYLSWRRWRPHWKLTGRKSGRAVLQRDDGMTISVQNSCCRAVNDPYSSEEEYEVALSVLRRRALPGWVTLDNTSHNSVPLDGRIYVNLSPAKLTDGWHTLIAALRNAQESYQLKIVNNRDIAYRPDCCVIYVSGLVVSKVASLVHQTLPHDVRDDLTPGFALPASRGIAVAIVPEDRPLASYGFTCAEELWMTLCEKSSQPLDKAAAWQHLQTLLKHQRSRLNGYLKLQITEAHSA